MTQDLDDIYPAKWFRDRAGYRRAYHNFARAIEELWHPFRLLDLGCGAGYVVEYFAGRIPTMGVDGSRAVLAVQSETARGRTVVADLTGPPCTCVRWFEFMVSIEVAEHIPPEKESAFLAWFQWADRVLLTAAPPGQGGRHHVNERPHEHWIARFAEMGFRHEPGGTRRWRDHVRNDLGETGCPWVVRNAMFFVRERRRD
jgi:SAM-dependent methyltransferase